MNANVLFNTFPRAFRIERNQVLSRNFALDSFFFVRDLDGSTDVSRRGAPNTNFTHLELLNLDRIPPAASRKT